MDCVREILSFLPPVRDTQGLHKYGYSEIPTYPYMKEFTFIVDNSYEFYKQKLEGDNEYLEAATWGKPNLLSIDSKEKFKESYFFTDFILVSLKVIKHLISRKKGKSI